MREVQSTSLILLLYKVTAYIVSKFDLPKSPEIPALKAPGTRNTSVQGAGYGKGRHVGILDARHIQSQPSKGGNAQIQHVKDARL